MVVGKRYFTTLRYMTPGEILMYNTQQNLFRLKAQMLITFSKPTFDLFDFLIKQKKEPMHHSKSRTKLFNKKFRNRKNKLRK